VRQPDAAARRPALPTDALLQEAEVERVLQICNACRYCEGFCAVFPAMARRLDFAQADIHYLANLCHNCGACLHACQYAPPHEFAVNVPQALARVRVQTYARYAWPAGAGRLYQRNGLVLALAVWLGLALFLLMALVRRPAGGGAASSGSFYDVFPHGVMVGLFAPVFGFAVLAVGMGVMRLWRALTPGAASRAAAGEAVRDALTLKYLDGGHGLGCHDDSDRFSHARRHSHHATFYGFMLCFAATAVATVYHYVFGWVAPYPLLSLPKILGVLGGLGLISGPVGLAWLHHRRHPQHGDAAQRPMDLGFIALLLGVSASGLLLMGLRATSAMPVLLCVHLGAVMALFATMPCNKFAHAAFRGAALLKWAIERRQPLRLKLGSE
jgi:citrate/tricarballylate utilization protein